ncbi:small subunit ribosomal protein S20 [Pseudobutyrivibrio sp. OR37]|uniref:30S ribosomal protein S20 n=1 Tax=Pseudobutyrivibrio sp. OR37 TaxID=1798186 RepID=UPI0008EB24FD|nr:30S ribosomal protein S20 [Pseudobutyrivibrio sp. OR37]SFH57343.1 small subunit ribosomal protein S20 [Pseudobutyrivibrio sp. OR37]
MANIKSAKKRVQVAAIRTERNKAIRSEVKTYVKRVEAAVESGDKAVAESELKAAIKVIEMAGSKGVYHDNTVSRKVSRLSKLVNKLA